MVSLVALIVWRLPFWIVLCGFLIFATLDGIYLTSAMTKVPDGAWFTLCLAVILSSIFVLWRFGKENQWHAEAEDRVPPSHILAEVPPNAEKDEQLPTLRLAAGMGGAPITHLNGIGVFFDKTGSANGTPTVFIHFLEKFQATNAVVVFFHIRPISAPTVAPEDRFTISRCFPLASSSSTLRHMYRVTIHHGYMDNVLTNDLGLLLYENLRNFIIHEGAEELDPGNHIANTLLDPSSPSSSSSTTPSPVTERQEIVRQSLDFLQAAFEDQVVFVVGKEQMRIGEANNPQGWVRRIALAAFLWLRSNTGSKVANMDLDVRKLVEVGFVKII